MVEVLWSNESCLACTDCTLGQITFTPAAGPGTETPVPEGPTCAADGSLTLVAICPATNTGPIFMQVRPYFSSPILYFFINFSLIPAKVVLQILQVSSPFH